MGGDSSESASYMPLPRWASAGATKEPESPSEKCEEEPPLPASDELVTIWSGSHMVVELEAARAGCAGDDGLLVAVLQEKCALLESEGFELQEKLLEQEEALRFSQDRAAALERELASVKAEQVCKEPQPGIIDAATALSALQDNYGENVGATLRWTPSPFDEESCSTPSLSSRAATVLRASAHAHNAGAAGLPSTVPIGKPPLLPRPGNKLCQAGSHPAFPGSASIAHERAYCFRSMTAGDGHEEPKMFRNGSDISTDVDGKEKTDSDDANVDFDEYDEYHGEYSLDGGSPKAFKSMIEEKGEFHRYARQPYYWLDNDTGSAPSLDGSAGEFDTDEEDEYGLDLDDEGMHSDASDGAVDSCESEPEEEVYAEASPLSAARPKHSRKVRFAEADIQIEPLPDDHLIAASAPLVSIADPPHIVRSTPSPPTTIRAPIINKVPIYAQYSEMRPAGQLVLSQSTPALTSQRHANVDTQSRTTPQVHKTLVGYSGREIKVASGATTPILPPNRINALSSPGQDTPLSGSGLAMNSGHDWQQYTQLSSRFSTEHGSIKAPHERIVARPVATPMSAGLMLQ
jgi:hypothetical protein